VIKMRKVIRLKDGSKAVIDTEKDKYLGNLTLSSDFGIFMRIGVYQHVVKKEKGHIFVGYSVTYVPNKEPTVEVFEEL